MGEHRSPDPPQEDDLATVREFIEAAREYHARRGEWPPDPLLDEIDETPRRIMAEPGNDDRKVLEWYVEIGQQDARENPDAVFPHRLDRSAGVSGR